MRVASRVGVVVTVRGTTCTGPGASDITDSRGRYEVDGERVACPLPWLVERAAITGKQDTTPASVELNSPPLFDRKFVVDFGVRPAVP